MKKLITLIFAICLLIAVSATALAYDGETVTGENEDKPTNVIITVVPGESEVSGDDSAAQDDTAITDGIEVYPFDVTEIREDGEWVIIRSYELIGDEKPEDIPRGSFERSGWKFSLTDIVRKDNASTVSMAHSETVEINSKTDNLEEILSLLSPTIEYRNDEGLYGTLTLDVSSIMAKRADDYYATGSYDVTAVYSGTIAKLTRNGAVFIAYFLGEKIEQTPVQPLPSHTPNAEAPADVSLNESEKDGVANTSDDEPIVVVLPDVTSNAGNNSRTLMIVIAIAAFVAGIAISLFIKKKAKTKANGKYRAMLLTLVLTGVVTASAMTAGLNTSVDNKPRYLADGKIAYIEPCNTDSTNNRSLGNKDAIYLSAPDDESPGFQPVMAEVRGYA